jgi:hypothetical protein
VVLFVYPVRGVLFYWCCFVYTDRGDKTTPIKQDTSVTIDKTTPIKQDTSVRIDK